MVVKLPTHDSVKTEPASLDKGPRIKTGKFAGLPAPTKGEKSQTLMLYYKGELVATYHSYRPRPGSAFTWRVAANTTGGTRRTNYFLLAKKQAQSILHDHGIHLSNNRVFKFGQGNFMDALDIEYAKVWMRAHPGAAEPTKAVFYSDMLNWLQSDAGNRVVVNSLIPRIREEVAKGNAGLAVSGARKTVAVSALAAGQESAFSPKRKNKNILNLGTISGAGIAPKRTATRAAPSAEQIENAFAAGVEAEAAREASQSPKRSRTARRGGSQ